MKIIEASLVYLFRDDKCLMLHRIKKENDLHKGKWNGLGGKSEPCESPEECALREIKEESGYKINKTTGLYSSSHQMTSGVNNSSLLTKVN
jgi:8-oxo-dGTP pyrophosphatase MutT (NUDIX family)